MQSASAQETMELNTIYNEPCLTTLNRMPDSFVDCVITSPPYFQLRDYGYDGQWGAEPTYHEYLEHLWGMMDEIYRVLKPTGTVWINLGDTYSSVSGSMGSGKWSDPKNPQATNTTFTQTKQEIPNKSLMLIPHRFAIGCSERGWIIRNDVVWAKRNAMPESVTDRFSKKHEYFFFMTKTEKYFFDLDAIRDTHKTGVEAIKRQKRIDKAQGYNIAQGMGKSIPKGSSGGVGYDENGKNPGTIADFWDIPTVPSSDEHYASYNDKLLFKPILAGCPEGGIIYDPFMGTGTTALVAHRAKRKFIGSEMGTKYFNDATKYLELIQAQTVLF